MGKSSTGRLGTLTLSREKILRGVQKQHEPWHRCPACSTRFRTDELYKAHYKEAHGRKT